MRDPFYVLVWIESTPPGARVVRISDGFVLARTPETVELLQSKEPVPIRIELEGYVPVTREVSAASDGTVTVSLDPTPRGSAVRTKKSRRGRQSASSGAVIGTGTRFALGPSGSGQGI